MTADAIAAAVCAGSTGAYCWLLLGWDRTDARRTLGRWGAAVLSEADLLKRALVKIFAPIRKLFGSDAEGCDASLGDVAEMVDIVRLGLSAGLSFDAALGLYCEGRDGPLSSRMAEARLSWQTGVMPREEALMAAARGTGLRAMEGFAVAVGQALRLGAPLADTLERQGREMRAAHRAEVERQIERAPVKLLIPTGTLILPALLVSIIGPLLAAGGML